MYFRNTYIQVLTNDLTVLPSFPSVWTSLSARCFPRGPPATSGPYSFLWQPLESCVLILAELPWVLHPSLDQSLRSGDGILLTLSRGLGYHLPHQSLAVWESWFFKEKLRSSYQKGEAWALNNQKLYKFTLIFKFLFFGLTFPVYKMKRLR